MSEKLLRILIPAAAAILLLSLVVTAGVKMYNRFSADQGRETITETTAEALTADASELAESEADEPAQESETAEASSESETEEETYTGLAAYMQGKLILNPEKVDLYLNVRQEMNEDCEILSVMYPNDILPYIEKKNGWYKVQCDGYTGYVKADMVLTDQDAYESIKHSVGYAVMAKEDSCFFYAEPDDTGVVINAAAKGDVFRVLGQYGSYYKVSIISPIYDYLYVLKKDVVLYYVFLSAGNTNELDEETENYLHSLNISANLEKCDLIKQEVAEEKEAEEEYEAYLSSVEAEAEAESIAKQESADAAAASYEASVAAAEEQSRAAESAAAAKTAAATQAAATKAASTTAAATQAATTAAASGSTTYLGVFMITNYCHCQKCCGVWGSNDPNYDAHGSSGMRLVDNYTIAVDTSIIPYGTKVMFNGKVYIAADTGVHGNVIDVYHQYHDVAMSYGCYYAEVYIVH